MKVYINPSKQEWNKGKGPYGTEEDRMHELANHIMPLLAVNGFTAYTSPKSMSLGDSIRDSNKKLGKNDIHIDLHTNAGGGEGTEVYYYRGNKDGKRLANLLYKYVGAESSSSDRGVHATTKLAAVRDTVADAVLVEYIFHDNAKDVAEWLSAGEIQRQAEATVRAICEYAGKKFKKADDAVTPAVTSKPAVKSPSDSLDTLAHAVIAGDYGTGEERKRRLGSRYDEVQNRVNQLLGATKKKAPEKSVELLAREVIDGRWGSGAERKKRLGKRYDAVQDRVNEILTGGRSSGKSISQLADEVIKGQHGTGRERMQALGSKYAAVQREVNRRLR